MSTQTSKQSEADERKRKAKYEPLSATLEAPGLYVVENKKRDSEHTVGVREKSCTCPDFQYRSGECKHLKFVRLIASGELCPQCGYPTCRPSCPAKHRR